jgi:hypothetical protein
VATREGFGSCLEGFGTLFEAFTSFAELAGKELKRS